MESGEACEPLNPDYVSGIPPPLGSPGDPPRPPPPKSSSGHPGVLRTPPPQTLLGRTHSGIWGVPLTLESLGCPITPQTSGGIPSTPNLGLEGCSEGLGCPILSLGAQKGSPTGLGCSGGSGEFLGGSQRLCRIWGAQEVQKDWSFQEVQDSWGGDVGVPNLLAEIWGFRVFGGVLGVQGARRLLGSSSCQKGWGPPILLQSFGVSGCPEGFGVLKTLKGPGVPNPLPDFSAPKPQSQSPTPP